MKLTVCLSVALVALQPCHSAVAGTDNVYVTMRGNITEQQKLALRKAAKVTEATPIVSLGNNVEIWTSAATQSAIKNVLGKSAVVSSHSAITGDYRELFTDLPAGADLPPLISSRIASVRATPTADSVRIVKIKPEALASRILTNGFDQSNGFAEAGTFKLMLADKALLLTKQKLTSGANGLDWTGLVTKEDDAAKTPAGLASITMNNGNVIGRVVVDRDVFSITPLGSGIHAISKVNQSKLPPEHPPTDAKRATAPEPNADVKPISMTGPAVSNIAGKDALPVINVAVFFTPESVAKLTGATPQHFAESVVNQTNASYVNSKVGARLNLVGVLTVNHKETDWDTDLDALENATGTLAAIRSWRKQTNAHIVVGVVGMNSYCGKARAILAEVQTAFALVSQECALSNLSFAHEIGHLQGARHDEINDPTATPYAYGHGYQYQTQWRTVMAYDCQPSCVRLPYWANPEVRYNGVPMGTPERNFDAKVLTLTAWQIKQFKP